MTLADVTDALTKAGASVRSQALVGSHARRYTVAADGKVLARHRRSSEATIQIR